jgi:hypothetical protein
MRRKQSRILTVVLAASCIACLPSCGLPQRLDGITILPGTETFGDANTPVSADAGLSVQLKALGSYNNPSATKDITGQVTWVSNTPDMVTVYSGGLITAVGDSCGSTLISATLTQSSGAVVTKTMTANVVCFTGTGLSVLVNFQGTGSGTVVSSPAGLSCANTCSAVFLTGATIQLTATANGTFGGWTGCDSVSTSGLVCTIDSLTTSLAVTATFN